MSVRLVVPLTLLVACDPTALKLGDVSDCGVPDIASGQPYSDATDPECTGVAVWPIEGHHTQFDGVAYVVDATGQPGGQSTFACAFEPHDDNCVTLDGQDEGWSLGLGGHGSVVGTEYDCLCADVVCTDVATGAVMREWTWELGSCAD